MPYTNCPACHDYMEARRKVVLPAIAEHIEASGEGSFEALDRYMRGVHDRPLTGFPLEVAA